MALTVAVLWSVLALFQLWLGVVSNEVFIKLTVSAGIIVGITIIVTLALREYLQDKDLKTKGFVDE
jgi:hypothetical protein